MRHSTYRDASSGKEPSVAGMGPEKLFPSRFLRWKEQSTSSFDATSDG